VLLRPTVVLALAVALASCTEIENATAPSVPPLYTTPSGLLTANPPQILVGAGDISDCGKTSDEATAKLVDNIPGTVFVLGDNVYDNGSTSDYQNCYGPNWGRFKARTKPSAGNHDYNTSGASGYYNYFGAAAGDPSKGYYTYEAGAWHVIVLNSNIAMTATSAQVTWLKADLAAHSNLCTLAYFHHPLYSSTGGSGSGGVTYSSVRPLVDALYAGGADLMLAGHRHFYERLGPIKPDGRRDDAFGVRGMIAGMGGKSGGAVTNVFPTSEVRNGVTFGVLKLYLYEDGYAWKFIGIAGSTFTDSGSTACHGAPGGPPPPVGGVSASQSTVGVSPETVTAASGANATTITVTAKDGSGNPVSGATVVLAATGSHNTLTQPTAPTGANGVATGRLSSDVAQAKIVSATINGVAITRTDTLTVTPDEATALAFEVQPATTAPGAPISPAVVVEVRDQFGNLITNAANDVTLAMALNPGGGTLSGTTTMTAVGGGATFADLSIDQEGIGYTLAASATGLSGVHSRAFDITTSTVATITQTRLTAGSNAVNQKIYTTGVIAPSPNALVTVAVLELNSTSAPPLPTLTGGGMPGWDVVASTTFDTGTLPLRRLTIFRALNEAPGSGAITITSSVALSNCEWIVSQWDGVDAGGVNGAGAIGQTGATTGEAASGLTVPLAAFGNANNVAYGVFGVRSAVAAVTPGTGFTEIGEQPPGESTPGDLEAEWATNRPTITATWAPLNGGALGVEIKARTTQP
jgi:hypothetical protein